MEKPDRLAEMCLQIGMQVDEQLSLLLGQPSGRGLGVCAAADAQEGVIRKCIETCLVDLNIFMFARLHITCGGPFGQSKLNVFMPSWFCCNIRQDASGMA